MNRLRFILALSHGCLAVGAVALYANPDSLLAALIAVGAFLRWMVPSKPKHIEEPVVFMARVGFVSLLTHWLMDCGLSEVIESAWHDRLSVRPVTFFASILLYLISKDWIYFTKLTSGDLDSFYEKKSQET